ncbi:MAG: hypothetical protein KGR69_05750 [Verrucomicrobia bacterium]|nr:hypothetical protein [Verrucomicrobiota bacterium]
MRSRFRRVSRRLRSAVLALLAVSVALAVEDRIARPSLSGFDPARIGRLEAAMWRDYYEHRWVALALDGLRVSCVEYGYSWWDGIRLSLLAARAALHFRGKTDDPRCLPLLGRHYAILADGLGEKFDSAAAARLELEWWRERRRKLGPDDYAKTIAANGAVVYGMPTGTLGPAALKRARAMHYRDLHGRGGSMSEADWSEVARQLGEAYGELKAVAMSR